MDFTLEKCSSSILCWAFPKGEDGRSFFSGYASSRYSQVMEDSYITSPADVSSAGTRPRGFFSRNHSGFSFKLMLMVSYLAYKTKSGYSGSEKISSLMNKKKLIKKKFVF